MLRPRPWLVLGALVLLCSAGVAWGEESIDEKDVIVLDDASFDSELAKHKYLLVEFYAPWCGHCKMIAPHWARAATLLKSDAPDVGVAKVDAEKNTKLQARFGIQGFPTIKWFVDGEEDEYGGGRADHEIVAWVKKKTGPPCKMLNTTEHLTDFKGSEEAVVLACVDQSEEYLDTMVFVYEGAARTVDDTTFAVSYEKEVHAAAGCAHGEVIMYKRHSKDSAVEELRFPHALATAASLDVENWVQVERLPVVANFSPDTADKIFTSPVKVQALLFADAASESGKGVLEAFSKVAADYRGKVVAVHVLPEGNGKVLEYFGVTEGQAPCVYLARMPEGQVAMKKYRGPSSEDLLKEDAPAVLAAFFDAYLSGDMKPHRKSEPVPDTPKDEHGVVTVVGDTFDELIADASKDVLLEFYAPWCGHCKQLAPIYDKLAVEMSSVESVIIAKMDATSNDPPEDIVISGFPSIKFWKAGSDRAPIDYAGERTVKGFRKFLKANAGTKFELPKKPKARKAEL